MGGIFVSVTNQTWSRSQTVFGNAPDYPIRLSIPINDQYI